MSVFPRRQVVNLYEPVKFFCNASGHPKPTISWHKTRGNLPVYHYVKPTYLQLPSVKKEDGGMYVCRAENSNGVQEEIVELTVNGTFSFHI